VLNDLFDEEGLQTEMIVASNQSLFPGGPDASHLIIMDQHELALVPFSEKAGQFPVKGLQLALQGHGEDLQWGNGEKKRLLT
jgi:hypothetical protein